ncbi:MAG: sigma-70 factor domain-containing protein, partial [Myxococcota bacterium]
MVAAATKDQQIERGPLLNRYLRAMGRIPLLKAPDEVAVAKRIEAGGTDGLVAKDELIR